MNKVKLLVACFIAALAMSGCSGGGTFDLSVTPDAIAAAQGEAAARQWCDERDADLAAVAGVPQVAKAFGLVFDVGAVVATAPIVAVSTGKAIVAGTTAAREAQCAKLRGEVE